jgi:hypothetical protein
VAYKSDLLRFRDQGIEGIIRGFTRLGEVAMNSGNLIFDIHESDLGIGSYFTLILYVIVGFVLSIQFRDKRVLQIAVIGIAIVLVSMELAAIRRFMLEKQQLSEQFDSGNFETVSGLVHDFKPQHGRGGESFRIKNIVFSYAYNYQSPRFGMNRRVKGSIRDGMHLKVTYLAVKAENGMKRTILRIESVQSPTMTDAT